MLGGRMGLGVSESSLLTVTTFCREIVGIRLSLLRVETGQMFDA